MASITRWFAGSRANLAKLESRLRGLGQEQEQNGVPFDEERARLMREMEDEDRWDEENDGDEGDDEDEGEDYEDMRRSRNALVSCILVGWKAPIYGHGEWGSRPPDNLTRKHGETYFP
jgi:hypothetical protein